MTIAFDRLYNAGIPVFQDPRTHRETKAAILAELTVMLEREERAEYDDWKCAGCGRPTVGFTMTYGNGVTLRFCGDICYERTPVAERVAVVDVEYADETRGTFYVWDEETLDRYEGLYAGDVETLWPRPGGGYGLGQIVAIER